jgi:hypothetical protein
MSVISFLCLLIAIFCRWKQRFYDTCLQMCIAVLRNRSWWFKHGVRVTTPSVSLMLSSHLSKFSQLYLVYCQAETRSGCLLLRLQEAVSKSASQQRSVYSVTLLRKLWSLKLTIQQNNYNVLIITLQQTGSIKDDLWAWAIKMTNRKPIIRL